MQENPEESPYSPPQARLVEPAPDGLDPGSHGQEITWGKTIAIWWSLGWRAALLGGGAALLSISILSVVIGIVAAALVGFSLALYINLRVTQYVFDKDFENFYLRLLPAEPSVTLNRAISIWWCYLWRSWVVNVPLSALGPLIFNEQAPVYLFVQSIVAVVISLVVFRTVLRKRYRRFVIDIVPHQWAGDKRGLSPTRGDGG